MRAWELEELKIRAMGQKLRSELKAKRRASVDEQLEDGGKGKKGKGKQRADPELPSKLVDPDFSTFSLPDQFDDSLVDFDASTLLIDFAFDGLLRLLQPQIESAEKYLSKGLQPPPVYLDPQIVAQCVHYTGYEFNDLDHKDVTKPADRTRTSIATHSFIKVLKQNGAPTTGATVRLPFSPLCSV